MPTINTHQRAPVKADKRRQSPHALSFLTINHKKNTMTTTYTEAEEAANALKMRFLDGVAAGPRALVEIVQEEAQKARNSADFKAVTHFALAARNTQDFFKGRDAQLYNFFGSIADAVENFVLWELEGEARAYFYDNYSFLPEEKCGVLL